MLPGVGSPSKPNFRGCVVTVLNTLCAREGFILPQTGQAEGASTVHSGLPQPQQLGLGISRPHQTPHIWVWRLKFYETLDKRNGKCLFFPLSSPCPFPLNSGSDL